MKSLMEFLKRHGPGDAVIGRPHGFGRRGKLRKVSASGVEAAKDLVLGAWADGSRVVNGGVANIMI